MTTATITSPLETFQHGRSNFLAVVLEAVSGLEGAVLHYEHEHEGKVRTTGTELSDALKEQARLEELVGEQALELDSARSHVCAAPVSEAAPEPVQPEADNEAAAAAARTIAELRSSLEAEQRTAAGLRTKLEAEQRVSAGLRTELEGRDRHVTGLEEAATIAENNLKANAEVHGDYIRDTQENFDQRLAAGVRAAETGVRGEAIRIIEAIAADNPALAEVADLFTVAFPAEASTAGSPELAAPVQAPAPAPAAIVAPVPAEDFFANIPAAEPEATEGDWDKVPAAPAPVQSFDFVPAPEPEAAPVPTTQVYMAAPDLENDAILDPNFFDAPQPLEAPAGEAIEAPAPAGEPVKAPKPGYGLFGRKKENSTV